MLPASFSVSFVVALFFLMIGGHEWRHSDGIMMTSGERSHQRSSSEDFMMQTSVSIVESSRRPSFVEELIASSRGIPVHQPPRYTALEQLRRLHCIRFEANHMALERYFLYWLLYSVRAAAFRAVQRRTGEVLWHRLGGRYFATSRLATERRLYLETLYDEAARMESSIWFSYHRSRYFASWQQWAIGRRARKARAHQLLLCNIERHAIWRFSCWARRRCRARRFSSLLQIRCAAERSLARMVLVGWQLLPLRRWMLAPLQAKVGLRLAERYFGVWRRYSERAKVLRRTRDMALWCLAKHSFQRWQWWLRRRWHLALLEQAHHTRLRRKYWSKWMRLRQLTIRENAHFATRRHLPEVVPWDDSERNIQSRYCLQ